ncbi:EF-hand domain-containing protein [Paramagnetospirillum magneticum]|uniref:Suppressor protein SRP40 n=1 Tax=Paramagnetospirillum magneticum (strain ATCC 700264 / AMB-1) TaxID=342108 RepID=Q2W3F3_PARM1|nr:EF-hand domain-containing protein [Paramagnetospirillum magneticum]BAE51622.1 Suppressor protein SRP40 [Paramagnetospirillum magneticum AMB-1]
MSVASVGNQSSIQSLLLNDLKKNGLTSDVASQVESEINSVFQSQSSSGSPPSPTDVRSAIEAKLKEDVSSGSLTQEQADSVIKALDEFESQIQQSGSAGGSQKGPDASELFSKLDSDGDGKLTQDEFVSGRHDNVSEDQAKQLYQKIAEKSGGDATSGLTADQFASGFSAAAPSGGAQAGGGAPPAGGGGGGGSAGGSSSGSSDEVVSVTTTTSADGTKTTVTKYGDGSSSTSTTYGQATSSSAETLQSILKTLTKGSTDSNETASYLNKLLSGNLIDTVA